MNPEEMANKIVGEVERTLNEESKDIQTSNVNSTRSDAEDVDMDTDTEETGQEENSGSDSKSRQSSSTSKYKAGKTVAEEKEVGSDVEDDEDESDNTIADTDAEIDPTKDENASKREPKLADNTGMVSEEEDMGDEEEAEEEDEYGEDAITKKIDEHLRSEEAGAAIQEHIRAMFSVEDDSVLTEEYTEKASTIFEAAVNERAHNIAKIVTKENTRILSEMKERLEEEAAVRESTLNEQIDEYLTHVCEEWMKENQLEVEKGLRTEITEEFLSDFTNLLETHNISIPEDQYDLVEEMSDKVDTLEEQLNAAKQKEANLAKQLKEETRQRLFAETSQNLTLSERERLENLSSHIIFEDAESYQKELKVISESYFNNTGDDTASETAVELNEGKEASNSTGDSSFMNLVGNMSKFSDK